MTTTPLWVPLVVASLGVGGVLFTQWRSDVRANQRAAAEERREEQRLAREAERERDARLFDHRRTAYASVIAEFNRWWLIAVGISQGHEPTPPRDAMADFARFSAEVDLYGGEEVASRSKDLYYAMVQMVYVTGSSVAQREAQASYARFIDVARNELGVPARVYADGRWWEAGPRGEGPSDPEAAGETSDQLT